jgi:hypothetical protein
VTALIVRRRVEPFIRLFKAFYTFEKKLNYESHTTQNFGFFTEYSITYQAPAPQLWFRTLRDDVVLS